MSAVRAVLPCPAAAASADLFRPLEGEAPTAKLSLATRRGDTNVILRNFLACAVS